MDFMNQFKAYVNQWKPAQTLDGTWVIEKGMGEKTIMFPKDKTEQGAQALADKMNAQETAQ